MPDLCRSCKTPIIWAVTENGRWMPLDLEPDPRGEWRIFGDTPRAVHAEPERRAELAETRQLHIPHWATCPHADQHRRPR